MPDGSDDWRHRRLKTTYEEARTVLDAQREVVADVDRKAMRTVQITVVLVGVLATGIEVAGVRTIDPWLFGLGLLCLCGSVGVGLLTYNATDLYLGPNGRYICTLTTNEFEGTTWDEDLLTTFGAWIAENAEDVHRVRRLLLIAHVLFMFGILVVGLSIVL